jgi:uncharacterized membrane protein HdeD (DUF308 family)
MHMTTISRPDAADVLARAGDHWGWLMGLGIITLLAVLGIISLILGLYAVRHMLIALLALALLLGIFWIINGAAELFMALSRQEMRGRAWTGLMGVLSVLAGLIVLIYPAISLLTLVVGPPPGTTRSQDARDVRRQPCQ